MFEHKLFYCKYINEVKNKEMCANKSFKGVSGGRGVSKLRKSF